MLRKERIRGDADVDTTEAHVSAVEKEISMIVVPHAVIHPRSQTYDCQGAFI